VEYAELCTGKQMFVDMNKKRLRLVFLCGAALLAVSCREGAPTMAQQAYPVAKVARESVETTADYPATIRGRQDVQIYPQVEGKLTAVRVVEGQRVIKGQTLFVIDQVPYRAALQTAVANVKAARAAMATARLTCEGKRELYAQKVISRFELSTAENALQAAGAQLAQAEAQEVNARNNLSYTVVKSPADGVVGTIPYRVGALVNSSVQQPLTTVSDNSEMYVYFSMPENSMLALIRRYGTVDQTLKRMPGVSLRLNDGTLYGSKGRVESISGVIDSQTGSVSLRAVFPNPTGLLHSGGAGNVVATQRTDGALTIPQGATFELQDKVFVYRVVDGRAKSTRIEVTPLNDRKKYIVRSGLKQGETIVTEGAGMLQDGMPITTRK